MWHLCNTLGVSAHAQWELTVAYVHEERAGQSFSVPVYESDGTTLIGEFIVEG